jgi:mRNA interferase HicA
MGRGGSSAEARFGSAGRIPYLAIAPNRFLHTSVDFHRSVARVILMKASEAKRFLKKHGCRFENHKGGSGHLTVYRGNRMSQLPMHGAHKDLGPKLWNKILKDLGIKEK